MNQSTPYQGISRKYRPQTFSSVVGQEAIVTTLKNAIRLHKTAQAYLFCGMQGTGKTTLARVLAKALNCHKLSSQEEPCNECPSCRDIIEGRSLNVLEIDGASHRGIDDIRQINETASYAFVGKYKIYIIDEVHMLTKEAFNALLKILEEPPVNVKFFFATTEPHKVLPTIISRCQRFDLQRIAPVKISQKLKQIVLDSEIPYEEDALHMLASLSDGSLRVAESLLDQALSFSHGILTTTSITSSLGLMPSEDFFALDKAFAEENLSYAFTLTARIFSTGKDLSYFLDCLLSHYRNVLSIQLKQASEEIPTYLIPKYGESAQCYTQEQCLYILDYLMHWHSHIQKTSFKRVTLEMLLLHILRSKQRVPIERIVSKLQSLEQAISQKSETVLVSPPQPQKSPTLEEPKPKQPESIKAALDSPSVKPQSHYDTLMRFASVELEGVLTKEIR